MKIWQQHGSEHSAKLVMIGHFDNADAATRAKVIMDAFTTQVQTEEMSGRLTIGEPSDRYGDAVMELFRKFNVASIGPRELEQFLYEVNIDVEENDLVLTTDELDVSVFLKVLIDQGARVEVYSAHNFPEDTHGRGRP